MEGGEKTSERQREDKEEEEERLKGECIEEREGKL